MNRHNVGRALLLAILPLCTSPLTTEAQQAGRVYRVGYLSASSRKSEARGVEAFWRRLLQ